MKTETIELLSTTLKISNPVGLHARPAALFVQTAAQFEANIRIRNITRDTPFVDAKSILGIMGIGVKQGHEVEIEASGEDGEEAIKALTELIDNNFGE